METVQEAELRGIVHGLDEYDADTVRYLAAQGVSATLLRRVADGLRR